MAHSAVVLGCGMIGATMARDLAADFEVTAADASAERLEALRSAPNIKTLKADLADSARLRALLEPFDIVLGAMPSRFGFQTLETVIACGKPYCDISFMPEDALELDGLAKEHGVAGVVDCGVSPGLSNMMVGHAQAELDETHSAVIFVGGLPQARHWPYEYKAPFAPSDVVEEYTRPARLIENGRQVVKPALSEVELIDFPGVGTLEAFNTDGLRSLLKTTNIPNMKEKTLRYPGHAELMRVLRETGFFGKDAIRVGDVEVRPLDITSRLLFRRWSFEPGEEEFTVLRVVVTGLQGGKPATRRYDLHDKFDRETGTSSMARTTAFPATITARLMVSGKLTAAGVVPPERIGSRPELFDTLIESLSLRGVKVRLARNEGT